MESWSLDDLHKAVELAGGKEPVALGVGARAFPRLGPGLFLPGYRLLCSLQTADLPEIRALMPVDCLQEWAATPLPACRDTLGLLSHPLLRQLDHLPRSGTRLVVYQDNPGLQRVARTRGWRIMANPHALRRRWENKVWFRRRLREAELPAAEKRVLALEDLTISRCRALFKKWRSGLVVQIPDFPRGGGRATVFVRDEEGVEALRRRWRSGVHRNHAFRAVMISPWIEGPSLSMEGCVLPDGVLLSPLQTQLTDLSEVLPPERQGRFCGHQWGSPQYPEEMEESARAVMRWVGGALRSEGYRGIYGVDFALDARQGQLYALECNPRYTGAFPVLTLLQQVLKQPPLEAFHLPSLMGATRGAPVEALNQLYREIPTAAQILLFHRAPGEGRIEGKLAAGRYRWSGRAGLARRLGSALPFPAQPWDDQEFLVLDGPPPEGSPLLPGAALERILRLIFFRSVLDERGALQAFAAQVVRWTYGSLGLEEQGQSRHE